MRILYSLIFMFFSFNLLSQTAKDAFKKCENSVVYIENLEGTGSGIMLDSKGLIITNHHVICSPTPMKVKAKILVNGKIKEHVFDDIKVIGYHPEYDAALIKINIPEGAKNYPISIASKKWETGDKIYAIGNPQGGEEVLRNTITDGIVSSSSRKVNDKEYIQVSAAINPGNSGGPLVNQSGEMIGVVTFIISQTEGLGFAIPFKNLNLKDFKPKVIKKADKNLLAKAKKSAENYFLSYKISKDEEIRNLFLQLTFMCYRIYMAEDPSSHLGYEGIGNVYLELKEQEIAEAYYKKALSIDPNCDSIYRIGMLRRIQKKHDEARKIWIAAIKKPVSEKTKANILFSLTHLYYDEKNYITSAYLAKWSQSLDNQTSIKKIFKESMEKCPEPHYSTIFNKSKDFSLSELSKLLKIKATNKEKTSLKMSLDKNLLLKSYAKIGKKPKIHEMEIGRIIPCVFGTHLAIKESDKKAITVLSLINNTSKSIKLKMDNFHMAAGQDKLFIFYDRISILETWDVLNAKKIKAVKIKERLKIKTFTSSIYADSQVFASSYVNNEYRSPLKWMFIDTNSGETSEAKPTWGDYVHGASELKAKLSDDSAFAVVSTRHDNYLLSIHRPLDSKRISKNSYYINFTGLKDSKAAFLNGSGLLYDKELKKVHSFSNKSDDKNFPVFRVYGSEFLAVLNLEQNNLELVNSNTFKTEQTYSVKYMDLVPRQFVQKMERMSDPGNIVVVSSIAKKFTVYEPVEKSLFVFDLVLDDLDLNKPPKASAGKKWTWSPPFVKGKKIKIEDGPEGLVFSGGQFNWSNPKAGSHTLLMSVTANGEENYKDFKIEVSK